MKKIKKTHFKKPLINKPKSASKHKNQSPPKSNSIGRNRENPFPKTPKQGQKWVLVYAVKFLVLDILVTRL